MTNTQSQIITERKENVSSTFMVEDNRNILGLYSFYDNKTQKFIPPFFALTEQEAIRQAQAMVNFSNSLICKFPEDYDLYYLGCFSEDTGDILPLEINKLVQHCKTLKSEQSIRYDELLKEIERIKLQASSVISDYEKIHQEYEHKIRLLNNFEEKGYLELNEFNKPFNKPLNKSSDESLNIKCKKDIDVFPTGKKTILKRIFK